MKPVYQISGKISIVDVENPVVFLSRFNPITQKATPMDTAEVEAVFEYVTNSKTHRKELLDYTEKHVGTSIALYATALRWSGDEDLDRLDPLVSAFEAEHPNLEMTTPTSQLPKGGASTRS